MRGADTTKFYFLSCLCRCIFGLMEIAKRSEPLAKGICYILRVFPAPSIVTMNAMSKMNNRIMTVLMSPPTLANEISHFTFLLFSRELYENNALS